MAFVIEAEQRTEAGKGPNRRLRAGGRIPGVLYGGGKETVGLSLDPKSVVSIIRSHGGVNTIFELAVKGTTRSTRWSIGCSMPTSSAWPWTRR
jgi:large subunit ribosomal protein L25